MKDVPVSKNDQLEKFNLNENKQKYSRKVNNLSRSANAMALTPLALLLAACGGGGGTQNTDNQPGSGTGSDGSGTGDAGSGTNTVVTSGRVIDGYISGIEVFRDLNGNYSLDSNESAVVTNSMGYYSGLTGSSDSIIVARDYDGNAVDVSTGLNFSGLFIAPSSYETVNPVSTIVSLLTSEHGQSLEQSEALVKSAFGIQDGISLSDFDPFAILLDPTLSGTDTYDNANAYQVSALQVANVLLASGGASDNFSINDFLLAAKNIAEHINENDGQELDLSNPAVVAQVLVSSDPSLAAQVASANDSEQYSDVLSNQVNMINSLTDSSTSSPTSSISTSGDLIIGETVDIFFKFSEAVTILKFRYFSTNGQVSGLRLVSTDSDGSVTYAAKLTPFTYGPLVVNVSNDYFDLQR